jgi:hypothetical protein
MDMGIVVLFIVLVLSGAIIWRVSKSRPPQDIPATTRSDDSIVPRRLTVHNSMSVSATARAKASTQFVDGTAPSNGATAPSPFTETLRRLPACGDDANNCRHGPRAMADFSPRKVGTLPHEEHTPPGLLQERLVLEGDGEVCRECVLPEQGLHVGGEAEEILRLTFVAAVERLGVAVAGGQEDREDDAVAHGAVAAQIGHGRRSFR